MQPFDKKQFLFFMLLFFGNIQTAMANGTNISVLAVQTEKAVFTVESTINIAYQATQTADTVIDIPTDIAGTIEAAKNAIEATTKAAKAVITSAQATAQATLVINAIAIKTAHAEKVAAEAAVKATTAINTATEAVIKLLKNPDSQIRNAAIKMLEQLGSDKATNTLIELHKHKDLDIHTKTSNQQEDE
jgi:HEAT repeat protein